MARHAGRELASVYNRYLRWRTGPFYRVADEDLIALLRPLFVTSFLIDDVLADSQRSPGSASFVARDGSPLNPRTTGFAPQPSRPRRPACLRCEKPRRDTPQLLGEPSDMTGSTLRRA